MVRLALDDAAEQDKSIPATEGRLPAHIHRHAQRRRQFEGAGDIDTPHPIAWMARRTRDVHDVWHVLSGYGRDGLGEACLVAFSYPQTRSLGWALIALGAISRTRGGRYPYAKAIWQGYQRGKKARWLLGEDYEALFAEPLDQARRRLGITPPTVYDAIPPEARDIVASPTPAGAPVPAGAQA